jgi:mono/diheme cytochrome c family protein
MTALRNLIALLLLVVLAGAAAQAQTLKIADRHASKTVTARQLLADPAMRTVTISNDSVYGRSMVYRALPAVELLKGLAIGPDDYVEFTATDKFSIGVPARLLLHSPDARPHAFLAVEAATDPWPAIPGHGKETPGPFFLVWQDARRGEISSEYWVYKLASLEVTDSPYRRWPVLNVAPDLPATHPARRGLDRYVTLCISCHRFNGAGEGEMGPDLAKPMNPVDYFQPDAFRKFLRSSKSVRDWPGRKMPSFVEDVMSNEDMEALIAWLTYKARQK